MQQAKKRARGKGNAAGKAKGGPTRAQIEAAAEAERRRIQEEEARAKYREIFSEFDLDESGLIDLEELKDAICHLGIMVTEEQLEKMLVACDVDDDGVLGFEEFVQFVKLCLQITSGDDGALVTEKQREMISEAFMEFDVENNGQMEVHTFHEAMAAFGYSLNDQETYALFNEIDEDGSGTVDVEEFILLTSVLMQNAKEEERKHKKAMTKKNPGQKAESREQIILRAAAEGDIDKARKLALKTGGHLMPYILNAQDPEQRSLLSVATIHNHAEFVEFLLTHKHLKIDNVDIDEYTPIHHAVMNLSIGTITDEQLDKEQIDQRVDLLRTIAKAKANLEACQKQGYTPLLLAGVYGAAPAIRVLAECGCQMQAVCPGGWTAMDYALRGPCAFGRATSAPLLQEWGLDESKRILYAPSMDADAATRSVHSFAYALSAATPHATMLQSLDQRCMDFGNKLEMQVAKFALPHQRLTDRRQENRNAAYDQTTELINHLEYDVRLRLSAPKPAGRGGPLLEEEDHAAGEEEPTAEPSPTKGDSEARQEPSKSWKIPQIAPAPTASQKMLAGGKRMKSSSRKDKSESGTVSRKAKSLLKTGRTAELVKA